jgi:hypothetical protein
MMSIPTPQDDTPLDDDAPRIERDTHKEREGGREIGRETDREGQHQHAHVDTHAERERDEHPTHHVDRERERETDQFAVSQRESTHARAPTHTHTHKCPFGEEEDIQHGGERGGGGGGGSGRRGWRMLCNFSVFAVSLGIVGHAAAQGFKEITLAKHLRLALDADSARSGLVFMLEPLVYSIMCVLVGRSVSGQAGV